MDKIKEYRPEINNGNAQYTTHDQLTDLADEVIEIRQRRDAIANKVFLCKLCLIGFFGNNEETVLTNHLQSKGHKELVAAVQSNTKRILSSDSVSEKIREMAGRHILVEVSKFGKLGCIPCQSLVPEDATKIKNHLETNKHQKAMKCFTNVQNFDVLDKLCKLEAVIGETHGAIKIVEGSEPLEVYCNICDKTFKARLNSGSEVTRHIDGIGHKRIVELFRIFPNIKLETLRCFQVCEESIEYLRSAGSDHSDHYIIKEMSEKVYTIWCTICDLEVGENISHKLARKLKTHNESKDHINITPKPHTKTTPNEHKYDIVEKCLGRK